MKSRHMLVIPVIVLSGAALTAPCFAQATATKPELNLGTAETPGMLTTPGSMYGSQPVNPATGTSYMPQIDLNATTPTTPQSTAINSATGTPYIPQVNMNSPATNDPAAGANDISAQPMNLAPSTQPNTANTTTSSPQSATPPQTTTPQ